MATPTVSYVASLCVTESVIMNSGHCEYPPAYCGWLIPSSLVLSLRSSLRYCNTACNKGVVSTLWHVASHVCTCTCRLDTGTDLGPSSLNILGRTLQRIACQTETIELPQPPYGEEEEEEEEKVSKWVMFGRRDIPNSYGRLVIWFPSRRSVLRDLVTGTWSS